MYTGNKYSLQETSTSGINMILEHPLGVLFHYNACICVAVYTYIHYFSEMYCGSIFTLHQFAPSIIDLH